MKDIYLKDFINIINDKTYILINDKINKRLVYSGKVKNISDEIFNIEYKTIKSINIDVYKSRIYLNINI